MEIHETNVAEIGFPWYYQLWQWALTFNCVVLIYVIGCVIINHGSSNAKDDSTYILQCPPINAEVVYLLVLSLLILIHTPESLTFNRFLYLIWANLNLIVCVIQCHNTKDYQCAFTSNERWLLRFYVQNAVTFLLYMTLITTITDAMSLTIDVYIPLSTFVIMVPNIIAAMTLLSMIVDLYLCSDKTRFTISPHIALLIILLRTVLHYWSFFIYLAINCVILIWKIGNEIFPRFASSNRLKKEEIKCSASGADSSSKREVLDV